MKTTQEEAGSMIVQRVADMKANEVLGLWTQLIYVSIGFTYVAMVTFQLCFALLVSPTHSHAVIGDTSCYHTRPVSSTRKH